MKDELQNKFQELESRLEYFEPKPTEEIIESFEETLNDEPVRIGNLTFEKADILKEMDSVCYEIGLNEYTEATKEEFFSEIYEGFESILKNYEAIIESEEATIEEIENLIDEIEDLIEEIDSLEC